MEKRYEQILVELGQELKANLNISYLLSNLVNQGLLTVEEEATLKLSSQSDLQKNSKFLSILITKGCQAFSKFLQALNEEHKHLGHQDLYRKLLTADKNYLNTAPTDKLLQPKEVTSAARADTSQVVSKNESETIVRHSYQSPSSYNSDTDVQHIEERLERLHIAHCQLMDTRLQRLEELFRSSMNVLQTRIGDLETVLSQISMHQCTRSSLGHGCISCSYSGSLESLDLESVAPEEEQQDVHDSGRSSPESDTYPAYKIKMSNYPHRHIRTGTKHMSLRPRRKCNSKNSTF